MYLTHSFVAIKKGQLEYLFFYLTEDYIQEQTELRKRIDPLLEGFGRNLLNRGAVVKAFDKDILWTKDEVLDKWKQQEDLQEIVFFKDNKHTPGLLMVDKDFDIFNPKTDQWLYVSFRDYMDDFGNFKIFELQNLLMTFAEICNSDKDLFDEAKSYIRKNEAVDAHKILEIKPGIFGISFDLKEAINFVKKWKGKYDHS